MHNFYFMECLWHSLTGKKNKKVINHLLKLKAGICLLQETQLNNSEQQILTGTQYNQAYSATYNNKQRGVSILISERIHITQKKTNKQNKNNIRPRRKICYNQGINQQQTINSCNLYGPDNDNPSFNHTFFSQITCL